MASRTSDIESGSDPVVQKKGDSGLDFQAKGAPYDQDDGNCVRVSMSETAANDGSGTDMRQRKLRREWSNQLFNSSFYGFPRENKEYGTWGSIVLAYQSLGVVFGDLGTSPLYVFPTIQLIDSPSEADYLGILSIIFWTMTLISLIKYMFIVMRADDHGEGGTFAVYSLLCQHANIGPNAGLHTSKSDMQLFNFTKNDNHGRKNRTTKFFEGSQKAQGILTVVVIIGAALVFGDGVLTPAISGVCLPPGSAYN